MYSNGYIHMQGSNIYIICIYVYIYIYIHMYVAIVYHICIATVNAVGAYSLYI